MNLNRQEVYIASIGAIAFAVSTILVIFVSLKASILGTISVIIMAIAYRYPRKGLWLFLIYMPFAGTISYAFGSIYRSVGGYVSYSRDYAIFHLVKDAFYLPALLAIVLSSRGLIELRKTSRPLLIAALLLLITCLLTLFLVNFPQQFDPSVSGQPFLMGLIGLKILIGYVPLSICGYYLIRDRADLNFLIRLQIVIIVICCSLCIIQYLFLAYGICPGNSHLPEPAATRASLQARCFVGGSLLYHPAKKLISLPGTFVAPWQWAWFLVSSSFLAFGAFVREKNSNLLWRIISLIAIVLILIAAIISGQTTASLLVPIIFLILLLFTESNKNKLFIKLGICSFLIISIANNFGVFGSAWDSIIDRWNYTPPQEFIITQFQWTTNFGIKIFGHGLGRAASAARRLGKIVLIETFYPRLLYEIGWLGTIMLLTVVTWVSVLGFKSYRSLREISLKKLAICIWLFIVLISYNTYYYPLAVDPVAIYYWFFAGVLLKLPKLETVDK